MVTFWLRVIPFFQNIWVRYRTLPNNLFWQDITQNKITVLWVEANNFTKYYSANYKYSLIDFEFHLSQMIESWLVGFVHKSAFVRLDLYTVNFTHWLNMYFR